MPADWGSEIVRVSPLFLLDTDPAVRVWAGNGWLDIPPDAVDEDGGRYLGAGQLLNLPAVSMLINGVAERVEFGLAGAAINSRVVELADEEAESVRGVDCWLGLVGFDKDEQITTVKWPWNGRADTTGITFSSGEGLQNSRQISISVGSMFTFRQRARLGFWVDSDQRRRSATDLFCVRVASYSVETTKPWPS